MYRLFRFKRNFPLCKDTQSYPRLRKDSEKGKNELLKLKLFLITRKIKLTGGHTTGKKWDEHGKCRQSWFQPSPVFNPRGSREVRRYRLISFYLTYAKMNLKNLNFVEQ